MWRVAQIAPADVGGGAAKVAERLQRGLQQAGHRCVRLVGERRGDTPDVVQIPNPPRRAGSLAWCLYYVERASGLQYLSRPGTRDLIRWLAGFDVAHLHNLHGDHLEPRRLVALCRTVPTVLTLHDAFLTTGHCAHPMDCPRWELGCGRCPDLDRYPGVRVDATAHNRRWYRKLIASAKPTLIAPSQWIRDHWLRAGMAGDPVVIPQGVDLDRFSPGDRAAARRALGLPASSAIVLFVAHRGAQNAYRDTVMLWEVLKRLARRVPDVQLMLLGSEGEAIPRELATQVLRVPHVDDERQMALHYQAADALLHPARADTAPLTVVEAMACGLPVVATRVGGIPELVVGGETGFLVEPGDDEGAAHRIVQILDDRALAARMARAARARAERCHDETELTRTTFEVYRQAMKS